MTVDADPPQKLWRVLRAVAAAPGLAYADPPQRSNGGFWSELLAVSLMADVRPVRRRAARPGN